MFIYLLLLFETIFTSYQSQVQLEILLEGFATRKYIAGNGLFAGLIFLWSDIWLQGCCAVGVLLDLFES